MPSCSADALHFATVNTSSPPPLTVAFITDAPRVAGSEIWLLDVLPLLTRHEIHSTVFLSEAAPLDELARRFEQAGVTVRRYRDLATLPGLVMDTYLVKNFPVSLLWWLWALAVCRAARPQAHEEGAGSQCETEGD